MGFSEEVDALIDDMAKPVGSLGLLEAQAKKAFLAWGCLEKEVRPLHMIFSADNGITRSGVVKQLREITYMQTRNMVQGKATISSFCKSNNIPYQVIDVGIDSDDAVGIDRKVARGTQDFSREPAMTEEQFQQAFAAGQEMVDKAKAEGYNLLSFGEMGIGNTTTSSAVLTAIAPYGASFLVGYGSAKSNYKLVLHKRETVRRAVAQYRPQIHTAADAIRCVGGFDLAALCGAMVACGARHMPFYIDGFITAVALACAVRLRPGTAACALPSHLSREPGMAVALRLCGMDEYDVPIHAGLALGEGTGAVFGVVLLRSVMYAIWHMATLSGINREAEYAAELKKK